MAAQCRLHMPDGPYSCSRSWQSGASARKNTDWQLEQRFRTYAESEPRAQWLAHSSSLNKRLAGTILALTTKKRCVSQFQMIPSPGLPAFVAVRPGSLVHSGAQMMGASE